MHLKEEDYITILKSLASVAILVLLFIYIVVPWNNGEMVCKCDNNTTPKVSLAPKKVSKEYLPPIQKQPKNSIHCEAHYKLLFMGNLIAPDKCKQDECPPAMCAAYAVRYKELTSKKETETSKRIRSDMHCHMLFTESVHDEKRTYTTCKKDGCPEDMCANYAVRYKAHFSHNVEELLQLSKNKSASVRAELAKNGNLPLFLLKKLTKDLSGFVIEKVFRWNKIRLTPQTVYKVLTSKKQTVNVMARRAIAYCQEFCTTWSPQVIELLAQDKEAFVRHLLLCDKQIITPPYKKAFNILLKDPCKVNQDYAKSIKERGKHFRMKSCNPPHGREDRWLNLDDIDENYPCSPLTPKL